MERKNFVNPFGARPWMANSGAATSIGQSETFKGAIAGGLTAATEICITFPSEYVKTQLQLDEKGGNRRYNGIADCVRKTINKRGFFGLYRGLSILIYGSIPKTAARFGAFEYLRSHLVDKRGHLSNTCKFICGLGAGCCEAVVAVTFMETVKVRLIDDQRSDTPQYKGLVHGVRKIIKQEGVSGVYKGLVPTIFKESSNQIARIFILESCKDWYTDNDRSKHVPKPMLGAFGILAGGVSVFGNTPMDVVKTIMQVDKTKKYKNTWDCAVKIWKKEGPFGFYKGTIPRLGRVSADVAITVIIYDSFIDLLNIWWKD